MSAVEKENTMSKRLRLGLKGLSTMTALLFAGKKPTATIVTVLLLALGLGGSLARAGEPVVNGYGLDLEAFFDATAEDCPECSAAELAELGQGLHFMLGKFSEETVNPFANICVAEAALSREMAVLTYELVRAGTITQQRWREYLRARAQIAGGLSEITKEEMLNAYLERLADRAGTTVSPDLPNWQAMRIYGSAQFSRLFHQISVGESAPETWAEALSSTNGGFHEVVDALLAMADEGRAFLDNALLESRPREAWIEGELPHLASLPPDFQVGDVPTRRDTILAAYDQAVRNHQWATFYFFDGTCGVEAQFGWREKAIDLAESFPWIPAARSPDPNKMPDDCGWWNGEEFGPPCEDDGPLPGWDWVPRWNPPNNPVPPRPPPEDSGRRTGEPRDPQQDPEDLECEDWLRSITDGRAACTNAPNDSCRALTSAELFARSQNCTPVPRLCGTGEDPLSEAPIVPGCIHPSLCNNLAETCRLLEVGLPDMGIHVFELVTEYLINPCQTIRYACRRANGQP